MPALDTNILVRWLVGDDAGQTASVRALFESSLAVQASFYIPSTVMLELEWVLRSRYRFSKAEIIGVMNALLEARELVFQDEAALERALHLFRQGTADFADCLHVGLCGAHGRLPLLTFDLKASRLPGFELLNT
jgi:predicted nucleic-acid-binding protein